MGTNGLLNNCIINRRDEFLTWAMRSQQCSEEESRDLYQVVMLIFYENVLKGKLTTLSSSVKTYLFGIAKNKIRELRRAKSKQVNNFQDFMLRPEFEDENEYELYESRLQVVENALNNMDKKCSDLLKLYYYFKKSMQDITEILDYKNAATTKNMKYKCIKRLKDIVGKTMVQHNT